jgi:hypothetical protein
MSVWRLQEEFERVSGSRRIAVILVLTALVVLFCLPLPP